MSVKDFGQMNDESTLREKAREAIQAGKLPNRRAKNMWGGPGIGACCPICDKPVEFDEVEFELEFAQVDPSSGVDIYHIHVKCFAAWELERHQFEPTNGKISSGDGVRLSTRSIMANGASNSG